MRPPDEIIKAFGGDPAQAARLPGGQGDSWQAGSVVLKPVPPGEPIPWLAALCARLPRSSRYRFAPWLPAADGSWAVAGWSATCWLPGTPRPGHWRDRLAVAAAFHADLPDLTPAQQAALEEREDQWSTGVRVAWRRQAPPDHLAPMVAEVLAQLAPLLEAPWRGPGVQLIHGDLAGNLLHDDRLPPAIIDMSPHLAPAPFAEAIIVADSVAWEGAPVSFAEWFARHRPGGRQLLARAVAFRLVTAGVAGGAAERVAAEVDGYRPVLAVCGGPAAGPGR